ncbi:GPR1/FUN34/YaaH family transporter [Amnibacterium sp. CER49]|nr:GPR1/FUN34/YaaH family transporter [Amnibacterium sp. CER49]MDH2442876.1 GPR1/FUN34/YaaH family transporter [Amnibacterium sp. CER49]
MSALLTVTASTTVEALRMSGALIALLALPALTFLLLAIGEPAGAEGSTHLGGHLGMLSALVASSMSFPIVLNGTGKRSVLPVLPRS